MTPTTDNGQILEKRISGELEKKNRESKLIHVI